MTTNQERPPGLPLVIATAAVAGLHSGLTLAMRVTDGKPLGYALGNAIAIGIAVPLVWLLLSQIVPKFRNARSRYWVILIVSILLLSDRARQAKDVFASRADGLQPSGSLANGPGLHFEALPETAWTTEDLPPPNRNISSMRKYDHVDGTKQIVVTIMKNFDGTADLAIILRGFKDGLAKNGVRLTKEESLTLGKHHAARLIADMGPNGEKVHLQQLFAVHGKAVYSIAVKSALGPVDSDKELAAWLKSLRIED